MKTTFNLPIQYLKQLAKNENIQNIDELKRVLVRDSLVLSEVYETFNGPINYDRGMSDGIYCIALDNGSYEIYHQERGGIEQHFGGAGRAYIENNKADALIRALRISNYLYYADIEEKS
jgi:hypothetical protein